ncbi:glycosyltransferase family 4 protein [Halobacterium jilantaiense]|uniref:Glycosyltransferase involved in cell wall bisynthesis n=1 Tax=Halobacterium jilantaiense TaxID=355548 RepID=A0A1I0MPU2_9EURY|nr:glycosyltransferase family 4 protein [Halobacterium jilantaiense]SEV90624.1 Glycosyltransferase involved in cell wall bisynthesis [Halobacterium jilantaiense]
MRVLNLVTTPRSRFYRQQVEALTGHGVEETTLAVPGHHEYGESDNGRTVFDYARFLPTVLRHAAGNYDLVHANYGLTAPHAVLQARLPVVVSLWGSDLAGRYGQVSRLATRFADAVVVMSEAMADDLGRDCHVVPHGVDLDMFRPEPTGAARDRLGWRDDARYVLFPYPQGRAVKNYPRADRVVDAARDRVDGDLVLQSVQGVDHEDMATYFNAADVLLLTSRREGSPNVVKEALACNLPVVSTDVGDVRERVAGVTASRVSDDDDELADGVVEAVGVDGAPDGRAAARTVGRERCTERLLDVYRSVLDAA